MTELIQISRRRWIVFALVIGCLAEVKVHAVIWNYETSAAVYTLDDIPVIASITISGQLTTDGDFANTQGSGSHTFSLVSFDSWFVNQVDQIKLFGNDPPSMVSPQSFEWNRESETVTSVTPESGGLLINALRGISPSGGHQFRLSFPNLPNASLTFLSNNSHTYQFLAGSETTLTPVPEPAEYAIVACLSMS